MSKPILLDLCCCAGGATRGYQRAGFYVVGVDKVARPNYCGDEFVQMDAVAFMDSFWRGGFQGLGERPDLIHWSPPCQARSALTIGTNASRGWGGEHEDLIPVMRPLIEATGIPNVLEQPVGNAPMRRDLRLCMDMFPVEPPRVWRHRWFEVNGFTVPQPEHGKHVGRTRGWRHGQRFEGDYVAAYGSGGGKATVPEMQHALGIDWTDVREELTEAIPPAYTELIGRAFLKGRPRPSST